MILPACNTEAMNLHLVEIAKTVAPGAHAVLMVDQAGWHMSTRLVVPPNITIIALPPKSPELNPVENVWQFMRDNWLSNRVFKSYDVCQRRSKNASAFRSKTASAMLAKKPPNRGPFSSSIRVEWDYPPVYPSCPGMSGACFD